MFLLPLRKQTWTNSERHQLTSYFTTLFSFVLSLTVFQGRLFRNQSYKIPYSKFFLFSQHGKVVMGTGATHEEKGKFLNELFCLRWNFP